MRPALFKGKVLGVVQAINSRSRPFDESDLSVLRMISRLVGYALHHARLYDDLATMKELEKRKAQFMRVMVHELKSPVTGAKMMADALQFDESVANTTAARMTERISVRMGRLLELIGDLLQLANVKSGEALGEVAVLDLAAETERVAGPYAEQAEQKGLEFVLETPVEGGCGADGPAIAGAGDFESHIQRGEVHRGRCGTGDGAYHSAVGNAGGTRHGNRRAGA